MSKDEYTLKEMLTELRMDMREHNERQVRMEEMLAKTYEQAIKTNGRVNKVEERVANLETEQGRFKTVVATIGSLVGIVWTGVTFFIEK
jgi:predicted nuclease with TOPRIM domain